MLEREGIGQIVFSPLAQGVLTGKYRPGVEPPAGSRATDTHGGAGMISRWMTDELLARVQLLQPLADDAGLSMATMALAWVLQNPNVASAIIGASRPEQVHENVKASGVTWTPICSRASTRCSIPSSSATRRKSQQLAHRP